MSLEYRFNFFLRLALEIFLETGILCLLNVRYMKHNNGWQIYSTIASILCILGLTAFFAWSLRYVCENYEDFRRAGRVCAPEVESMFGCYKIENMPQILFNTFFMLRRTLYACIIIFMVDYPIMQAFFFMVICLPILAYHLVMNPYIEKVNNCLMDINEGALVVIGVFFFKFAEPETDQNLQLLLGWIVIGIIFSLIFLNIIILWTLKIIDIKREIVEYFTLASTKAKKPVLSLNRVNKGHKGNISFNTIVVSSRPMCFQRNDEDLSNRISSLRASQFLRVNTTAQSMVSNS